MKKLIPAFKKSRISTLRCLDAAEVVTRERSTELTPDFDVTPYKGMTEQFYPIWLPLDFHNDFTFLHSAQLDDYGYKVPKWPEDRELPRATGGNGDRPDDPGALVMALQSLDRFSCRCYVRGQLHGTSAEMSMTVTFRFTMTGFIGPSKSLGFTAEAMAEGYAFECQDRLKQAFFSYFTAIDSFIETERDAFNRNHAEADAIPVNDGLFDKFSKIAKWKLRTYAGLNAVPLWSEFANGFKKLEKLRNGIAHNSLTASISKDDVDLCFAVAAIAIAMVEDSRFDEAAIRDRYDLG